MRLSRFPSKRLGVVLTGVLLLTGCTGLGPGADRTPASEVVPSSSRSTEAAASTAEQLSDFEQQLPMQGAFVSQQAETTGTALIERRSDGSTWVTLKDFETSGASDVRLSLKEGALEQDSSGAWVDTAGYSYEIGQLDPADPEQEIEIPGADLMPTIRTLTVMSYSAPDYPSLGSVALAQ